MADFIPYAELTPVQKSMVDSPDCAIRQHAVYQGLCYDKLINDPHEAVRSAVAEQDYGHDRLVNDPDAYVRACVADRGYGLDKLFNDPDPLVRQEVEFYLRGHNLTLKEWILNNTDKCALPENRNLSKEAIAREKEQLRIAESIDASFDPVPAHPSYTAEELIAMLSAHPDVVHASIWTHDDLAAEVERLGYDPSDAEFMEAVCEDVAEALDDQEESLCRIENVIEYHAPSDCEIEPGKTFIGETQQSHRPASINPKDDIAQARAATSPCMRNHVQNPTRSQGR